MMSEDGLGHNCYVAGGQCQWFGVLSVGSPLSSSAFDLPLLLSRDVTFRGSRHAGVSSMYVGAVCYSDSLSVFQPRPVADSRCSTATPRLLATYTTRLRGTGVPIAHSTVYRPGYDAKGPRHAWENDPQHHLASRICLVGEMPLQPRQEGRPPSLLTGSHALYQ